MRTLETKGSRPTSFDRSSDASPLKEEGMSKSSSLEAGSLRISRGATSFALHTTGESRQWPLDRVVQWTQRYLESSRTWLRPLSHNAGLIFHPENPWTVLTTVHVGPYSFS